jgi:hypothetical protein
MRVDFKFRESAPADQRKQVIEQAAAKGHVTVAPLFPDEQDPELASMYKAEGVPAGEVEDLVTQLGASEAVEFAERTPERKLIR